MDATQNEEAEEHSEEASPAPTNKASSKQISRKFSVAICLLLVLAMCVFWLISSYNTQNLLRQQADGLGQSLARQTAAQLTELMLANDLISMNVVLGTLIRDSSIAAVSVVNVNNEIIASATGNEAEIQPLIPLPITLTTLQAEYSAPITLADSIAGFVRLRLDLSYIEAGMVDSLILIIGATILLIIVAVAVTSTYFQYLVSFPANLLSFSLSNIRKGEIETCPEPTSNNEISTTIRQFNATAEFLAQNTFLNNFGTRQPEANEQTFKTQAGMQDATLLVIRMSNFQYLASTVGEIKMVELLNKYYFYAGKVSQLYNGTVNFCSDDEVLINFSTAQLAEEQAFYAICAAQLFLQLVGDINDIGDETVDAKFKLAVHSGKTVSGLYSPITQDTDNLTGKTLDLARDICDECPNNSVLISEAAFEHAGAGTRIEADEYGEIGEQEQTRTFIGLEPMSEYRLLLERQAIQLVTVYSN
ncbi:MAG: AhpA/YtjB family protein [Gammaproteobacteria bacterium]|nr:AhpA/YtjB family protein [Gammaproteobacteria bacterium]MDD9895220.1 AhpA/YtjB family protein [Gammaproteobacteria bacterium]MDD9958898.1 AhpA/YtjB family protein [Gammaproteobacteria bacterium]